MKQLHGRIRGIYQTQGVLVCWTLNNGLCPLHAGAIRFFSVPRESSESSKHLLPDRVLQLHKHNCAFWLTSLMCSRFWYFSL